MVYMLNIPLRRRRFHFLWPFLLVLPGSDHQSPWPSSLRGHQPRSSQSKKRRQFQEECKNNIQQLSRRIDDSDISVSICGCHVERGLPVEIRTVDVCSGDHEDLHDLSHFQRRSQKQRRVSLTCKKMQTRLNLLYYLRHPVCTYAPDTTSTSAPFLIRVLTMSVPPLAMA